MSACKTVIDTTFAVPKDFDMPADISLSSYVIIHFARPAGGDDIGIGPIGPITMPPEITASSLTSMMKTDQLSSTFK